MSDINFSNLNVLIVDDLGSVRKVLRKILAELGAKQVIEAVDGEEALQKITSGGYDLVISDWEMPKINGVDLIKKLRAEEKTSKLPFIMITAHGTKESVIAAVQAGVSNFIVKPFSAGILKSKISEALSSSFNLQNILSKLPTSQDS
jgi:two-component system chemotaxis response regulator CheY